MNVYEKDIDDLIALVKVRRVDKESAEMRELFLKHGTPELYEKIRRTCKPA